MTAKPTADNENIPPLEVAETAPAEISPLEAAQSQIQKLEEQVAEMRDQWVRAVAETENLRKRSQRDIDETAKYAASGFARDMVGVLENLIRASESISPEARTESELLKTVGEGIDLTLDELLKIFEKNGIRRINPMGEKFDHHFHQALVQMERSDVPPGTVVQVVQAGYVMRDRLLRPAMVAVSKQGEPAKQVDTTA